MFAIQIMASGGWTWCHQHI